MKGWLSVLGVLVFSFFISFVAMFSQNIYNFQFDGKDYAVVKEKRTFAAAAMYAVENGAHLVEINGQEEQDAIYNAIVQGANVASNYTIVMDGGGVAYVWIGATDAAEEGKWIWDGDNDGVGTNFWNGQGLAGQGDGSKVGDSFVYWGGASSGVSMEPDNFNNNQNAAAIALDGWPQGSGGLGRAGEWNDLSVGNTLYFVIEYKEKLPDLELEEPENDAEDVENKPVFRWKDNGAETYTIQVSRSEDIVSDLVFEVDGISENTYTSETVLDVLTKYYWRVKGVDADKIGDWSETRSFTTAQSVPETPQQTYPENNANDLDLSVDFEWQNAVGAEFYHLQCLVKNEEITLVDKTDIPASLIETTKWRIDDLANATKYEWRVRGGNSAGWGDWTEFWEFETVIAAPNSAPNLTNPPDGATDVEKEVKFTWDGIESANKYFYEVYISNNDLELLTSGEIEDADDKIEVSVSNLQEATEYKWRVKAINAGGSGPFSEYFTFTTDQWSGIEADFLSKIVLKAFPNPAGEELKLSFMLDVPDEVEVKILSASRPQMVRSFSKSFAAGKCSFSINTSNLPNGIYIAELKIGDKIENIKFVVVR